MANPRTSPQRGRVLLVGAPLARQRIASVLAANEYELEQASLDDAAPRAAALSPEALLLSGDAAVCTQWVPQLRAVAGLSQVPLLVAASAGDPQALRAAGADELVEADSPAELYARLDAAIRAKRLADRAAESRARLQALIEISQVAASSNPLEDILPVAVTKIARVLPADRCSVVLAEGPDTATVVATHVHSSGFNLTIPLARYPEIRKALTTREAVCIDDAMSDPLLEEVRPFINALQVKSILVQPLIWQDEQLGVLFLRLSGRENAYGREELEFAGAAGSALASLVRTVRQQALLRKQRDELESAYVERYRELVDANHRLKELNRFKDETLAVCSHDLRGPLGVVLGHAKLLLGSDLEKQQQASVEAIQRQGRKLLELVEHLLERGRGDAARLALEPEELDLSQLCRELAGEHEIIGAERGVSIQVSAPAGLSLLADRVKMRQVLQNLLTNAIGHAREGGEVRVAAELVDRPDGQVARVSVSDDGAGIPAEEIALVFDRYRHGPEGVGLGLAICREYVELHGGEIWAESETGKGSTFLVTLPITDVRLPRQGLTEGARSRVLLVEDEPDVAAITAEILRARYRVDQARDGAEAIAKARALKPDLILMDVFLPRVDGLDAAAALQAAPDTRDIPVVLVSAHRGVAEKVRALNLGAVDYLAKPFQSAELLERVEKALQARAGRRSARQQEEMRRAGLDPTTGLLDAEAFQRYFAQSLSRSRRYGQQTALVAFHPSGPVEVRRLGAAAGAFKSALRNSDLLAHLGGGRFAACLPDTPAAAARSVSERVAAALEEALATEVKVTVVDVGSTDESAESLLATALAARG